MISDHPDPLTTAQTQKGDQIYARVDYLAGTVPFVLTPEITIENSPPEIPNYSFQRQIPGPSFVPYSGNEFAKTDDIVKCMMDAPAVDADLDPLSYYLTLESPGTRTSSISTTTHDIAIEQTLNVMNPGANDVVSCTASVQDDALALTSTAAVRTICEKEYTTFSGTQYIQFAEHGGFGFGRYTGTIEAWVYWHGGQTQNSYIYSRWWDSNADHAFGVDSLGRLFGVLSGYYGNLIINSVTTTGHSLEPHKWTHVAMTWVANGSMYLFINGEQKGSAALQTEISGGGGPILGWPAARGANRQPLFGSIASFRISSTVRYDHNVDFTPDRNYGFDADTKIFIPLDEGSGTANVTATQTDGMGGSTTIQSITNTSSLWATERCIRR